MHDITKEYSVQDQFVQAIKNAYQFVITYTL